MKKSAFLCFIVCFLVTSCIKEQKQLPETGNPVTTVASNSDTIPDKAVLKLKLVKDSTNYDETAFSFDHTASLSYAPTEDATYLTGFGTVSLSSLSNDGTCLAINRLPYRPGMVIGLDANTKADGNFSLKMSYINKIPPGIQVWLRDNYLNDSINLRKVNYNFSVLKADTNSFGKNRFKVTLRDSSMQASTH
jgi:hypothetical protein